LCNIGIGGTVVAAIHLISDPAGMAWTGSPKRKVKRMQQFKCQDMGMKCDFVATGQTVQEVMQKAMAHAQEKHADMLKTMTTPEQRAQMQKQLQGVIKSV
jgi:predicted small metal-binding protein